MSEAALPVLNSLWVEGRLGWLERLCLGSAVRQGYRVVLWQYFGVEGAPEGVEVRDAREVMPETQMIRHRARDSWSLGSNIFRYHLMRQGRGVWIDADVYLLKPIPAPTGEALFGLQKPKLLNGAVLWIAPDSALLDDLFDWIGQAYIVPVWEPWRKRIGPSLRKWLRLKPLPLAAHRWGVIGPRAITHLAQARGLDSLALPQAVFYPWGPKQAKAAFDPAGGLDALIRPETVALHFWNEEIKALKAAPPPPGSLLARLCAADGIAA